jgi:hypothetical protein
MVPGDCECFGSWNAGGEQFSEAGNLETDFLDDVL